MEMNETPVVEEETKAPEAPAAEPAEVVEEKKGIVNCPKCGTALHVKVGNIAYLCPVCSQMFRTRLGERLVKDVTPQTMVEAYVNVGKDVDGQVKTDSVIADKQA